MTLSQNPLGALLLRQGGEEGSIVHQDVDPAEPFHGGGDQGLDRAFIAHVGDCAGDGIATVRRRNVAGDAFAVRNVGDHHARALGGKRK
jgi:hypothetical protein